MAVAPDLVSGGPFEVALGCGPVVWKGLLTLDAEGLVGELHKQRADGRLVMSIPAVDFYLHDVSDGPGADIGRLLRPAAVLGDWVERAAHPVSGRFVALMSDGGELTCVFRDTDVKKARWSWPDGVRRTAWLKIPDLLDHLTHAFRRVCDD